MKMKLRLRTALFVLSVAAMAAFGLFTQTKAQIIDGYQAYQWRRGGGDDITDMLQNQRNTEAAINEMRAARHQPPCSIGLLGQWQGKPRCP
jgi:hypothetical protein